MFFTAQLLHVVIMCSYVQSAETLYNYRTWLMPKVHYTRFLVTSP